MYPGLETFLIDGCYHGAANAVFDHYAGHTAHRFYLADSVGCLYDGTERVVDPSNPRQALDTAIVCLGADRAICKLRGRRPIGSFEEFVRQAEAEWRKVRDMGLDCDLYAGDIIDAARCLQLAAGGPNAPREAVEERYGVASDTAATNVELWWPEIDAVARRLLEVGVLRGEMVTKVIESNT